MKKRNTNKVLTTFISFITTCLVAVFFVLLVGCDDVKTHNQYQYQYTTNKNNQHTTKKKNNQYTSKPNTHVDVVNEYIKDNHQDNIAVVLTFKPTHEITDYIKNTSLEDIIIQDQKNKAYKLSRIKHDSNIQDINELSDEAREILEERLYVIELKCAPVYTSDFDMGFDNSLDDYMLVPINSSLAKVFYLEDFYEFVKYNIDYYESVMTKFYEEQDEKRELDRQESWKKYLE